MPSPTTPVWRLVFAADASAQPLYIDADSLRAGAVQATTRTSVTVDAGARLSLASYFNAFPASYWRHSTRVRAVSFRAEVDQPATVTLHRSDADGRTAVVAEYAGVGAFALDASIESVEDGGWLWIEVAAGDAPVTLSDGAWCVPEADRVTPADARTTIGITTFNLPTDCLANLARLAADPVLLAKLGRIVVVDQGTKRVRETDGFGAVAAALGDQLLVIEQENLGGSGGFSRGMAQAVADGADYVLLLDDDVVVEPEAILRAIAFAEFANAPTLVGGHMLDLSKPTILHSFGETIDAERFWWHPVNDKLSRLDFAEHPLVSTPALHRRIDVAFNGWWMCLIPTAVIREIGASLPLFIKWDDAEFGVRAREHGYPTVSLPGVAVWHVSWLNKDDGLDWQAYFQLRNRLVAALLHSGQDAPRGLLRHILAANANHLICQQYGSVELRNLALRDVLRGPQDLVAGQGTVLARVREALAETGQVIHRPDEVDGVDASLPYPDRPRGRGAAALRLARVGIHQLRRSPSPDAALAVIPRSVGKWWGIGIMDGAAMDAASGKGVFVLRRDRGRAWRGWRETRRLLRAVRRGWSRLAREYAAELLP